MIVDPEEALLFIQKVQAAYSTQPQVYVEFLNILNSFECRQVDDAEVTKRCMSLFRGNTDLIVGFGNFLPEDTYNIDLSICDEKTEEISDSSDVYGTNDCLSVNSSPMSDDTFENSIFTASHLLNAPLETIHESQPFQDSMATDELCTLSSNQHVSKKNEMSNCQTFSLDINDGHFDDVVNYVLRIQEVLASEIELHESYLKIMVDYQKNPQEGFQQVLNHISNLFVDYPDLIRGFVCVLPSDLQEVAQNQLETVAKATEERLEYERIERSANIIQSFLRVWCSR